MKIKLNFNVNLKKAFQYISLVLVTALLISTTLVALPLTEKISEKLTFNLNTKDSQYWSKEYFVKVESKDEKEIKKIKEVFYRRLRGFGVENSTIFVEGKDEESTKLRIVVNTTKNEESVAQLIANRFYYKIVTRKADVDFDDEENPLVVIMGENYDTTEWDQSAFREVYIPKQKLRASDGNYRYFAIFKQKPSKNAKLNEFLKARQGETIGVDIDEFVTPYQVPIFQEGSNKPESITVGVNADDEESVKVIRLLYNSGHIPAAYTLESQNSLEAQNVKVDYIKVTIGFAISLIAAYLFLFIFKYDTKENLIKSLLGTIIALTAYLAYLKLTQVPVDTFLLTISAILTSILIRALVSNRDSEIYIIIGAVAILITISILGTGFMRVLAIEMIALIAISKVSLLVAEWYLDNVRHL